MHPKIPILEISLWSEVCLCLCVCALWKTGGSVYPLWNSFPSDFMSLFLSVWKNTESYVSIWMLLVAKGSCGWCAFPLTPTALNIQLRRNQRTSKRASDIKRDCRLVFLNHWTRHSATITMRQELYTKQWSLFPKLKKGFVILVPS